MNKSYFGTMGEAGAPALANFLAAPATRGACTTGAAGAAAPLALVVRGQAGAEKCPFTILGRLAKSVCYIKRARLDENVSETLHDWKRQHTHCSMLGCTVHAKC